MTDHELIVDSFAGGGGASLGIARALGRGPDVAINHDAAAIAMHAANHPETRHYTEDVWKISPREVTGGRPVGLLWASPDCKHFSRAKGGKPVEKNIRSLAWVVVRWAESVSPRVIILENVREFEDWGPLLPQWACRGCDWRGTEGQTTLARARRRCPRCESPSLVETENQIPDPTKKGLTFRRWVGRLRTLGYAVEWRTLNAADFGAPTHRRRLFLIARRDGQPIVWPDATHGDPRKIGSPSLFEGPLEPWRTAAECIDWSLPCPSIFLTREEGRKVGVNRPLADKTMRRIALGIKRYVLENPKPFIVRFRGDASGSALNIDSPLPTITAGSYTKRPAGAGHALGICVPHLVDMQRDNRPRGTDEPMGTVTTQGNRFNLVTPLIVPVTHAGERRANIVTEPLPTITGAHRGEIAVCVPVLHNLAHGDAADGRSRGLRANSLDRPLGTVHAGGGSFALVAAFLAKHFGGVVGHSPDRPIGTVTAIDHHSVVTANLVHFNHGQKTSSGCDDPMRTATAAGNHAALVYGFLTKYYGLGFGSPLVDPMPTATSRDHLALITVWVDGDPYVIADIGMRMLTPRELARGQGFPDDYILTGTKSSQVARVGNSVCPVMAEVLCRANFDREIPK